MPGAGELVTGIIQVRGLRATGTHGALPEEQARAQPFEVDIDVALDLSAAGRSDDLGQTLDYGAVAAAAERVIVTERWALLERLAERIAEEVLACPSPVTPASVTITVRKLRPPVPQDLTSAGVQITREPPGLGSRPARG